MSDISTNLDYMHSSIFDPVGVVLIADLKLRIVTRRVLLTLHDYNLSHMLQCMQVQKSEGPAVVEVIARRGMWVVCIDRRWWLKKKTFFENIWLG